MLVNKNTVVHCQRLINSLTNFLLLVHVSTLKYFLNHALKK